MDTPDFFAPPTPEPPDESPAPSGPVWFLLGMFAGLLLMCLIRTQVR